MFPNTNVSTKQSKVGIKMFLDNRGVETHGSQMFVGPDTTKIFHEWEGSA